jgi:hypothetical protein
MRQPLPSERIGELEETLKMALASALDERSWFQGSYEMNGDEAHQEVAQNIGAVVSLLKDARMTLGESISRQGEIDPKKTKAGPVLGAAVGMLAIAAAAFGVISVNPSILKALPW